MCVIYITVHLSNSNYSEIQFAIQPTQNLLLLLQNGNLCFLLLNKYEDITSEFAKIIFTYDKAYFMNLSRSHHALPSNLLYLYRQFVLMPTL